MPRQPTIRRTAVTDAEDVEGSKEELLALLALIGKRARKYFAAAKAELEGARTKSERLAWRKKWHVVAEPEAVHVTPITTKTAIASLATYLWRLQKRMWNPAKRDLAERLQSAAPGDLQSVVSRWSAQWRERIRIEAPTMRRQAAEVLDRTGSVLQRQIERQLLDSGYTPRPSTTPTTKVAERAVQQELGRFEGLARSLEQVAAEADLLQQGPDAILTRLDGTGPTQAGSGRNARNTVGLLLSLAQKEAFAAAGVQRARWETKRDQRVRPTHRARQGKEFDVDKGLGGIWPGQESECRCVAIPAPSTDPLQAFVFAAHGEEIRAFQLLPGSLRTVPVGPVRRFR